MRYVVLSTCILTLGILGFGLSIERGLGALSDSGAKTAQEQFHIQLMIREIMRKEFEEAVQAAPSPPQRADNYTPGKETNA